MTDRKQTTLIVVHVTATPPKSDIGVKEVRVMHKARGFNDIGYHYVIRRNGKIETGRAESAVGAHVQGYNSTSIGVSMVGGVDASGKPENNATPEQWASLESILKKLTAKYPKAGVCGHRDLSPDKDGDGVIEPFEHIKACPCFDAIPWAASKGIRTANIKGVWYKQAKPVAPIVVQPKPVAPVVSHETQSMTHKPDSVSPTIHKPIETRPEVILPPINPPSLKMNWFKLIWTALSALFSRR